jgi:hypothetical protein
VGVLAGLVNSVNSVPATMLGALPPAGAAVESGRIAGTIGLRAEMRCRDPGHQSWGHWLLDVRDKACMCATGANMAALGSEMD